MSRYERDSIYNKTNGRCYYCGCELPDRWHVDHLFPQRKEHWLQSELMMKDVPPSAVPKGLEDIDDLRNLVPSCPRCNIRKGALDVEQFRSEIQMQVDRLKRDSNQYNLALDYGLIKETDMDVIFYFEQIPE